LFLFVFLFEFQTLHSQITATQMGMLDFQVNQSLTADEMNGTTDVTTKLQAAVNAARLANKTLFIPTGTYKVSNTIDCVLYCFIRGISILRSGSFFARLAGFGEANQLLANISVVVT